MDIKSFREIMKDIDEKSDGDATMCWFLVQTGRIIGTWEWLESTNVPANMEVIIVSEVDKPPCYVPVASIIAVQVAPS